MAVHLGLKRLTMDSLALFSERVISFNSLLRFDDPLPPGIRIMNPFSDSPPATRISSAFYNKYYSDNKPRRIILGINPGRHGAGLTGIPFTDTKRLYEICSIDPEGLRSHEPSSVFIYEMIEAFGGPGKFYEKYYINSVCPLGFVREGPDGKVVNYNYYDSRSLKVAVEGFIEESLRKQVDMGIDTSRAFCLGTGKNFDYLAAHNERFGIFNEIIPLEHPRYIMQYRSKEKQLYIDKYLSILK